MRAGFVNRTDLPKGLYISDVENTSQRNFSSEPPGQSRYLRRPTDAEVLAALNTYAFLTIQGSDTAATVDTTGANGTKLNIRDSASGTFIQVTVTSDGALAKTVIVTELNAAFTAAGLGLVARIAGTNQITIDTTTAGPAAYVEISAGTPSAGALHTVVGLAAAATSGLGLAAWRTAVYPTATTIDISTATIAALSTYADLTAAAQAALVDAVADVIAPELLETGAVLLSFAGGILSRAADATFQPGGTRIGLAVGPALAILEDDGSTPFTL